MKTIYDHTLRHVAPIHRLIRVSVRASSSLLLTLASGVTRFELPRDDVAPYFRFALVSGHYQEEVVALYRSLLRPGMIVVDVGAHAGYHTLRFARLVRPTGRVIAFEPSPATFSALRRNIVRRRLSNVTLEQKAVTCGTGKAPLYYSYSSLGHSIVPSLASGEHTLVDCVSLDRYCEAIGINNVNLIKINAEGAEVDVLSGMQSLLQRSADPWVIAEFSPKYLKAAGYPPSRLIDFLLGLGFQIYEIGKNGVLTPLEAYGRVDSFISSVVKLTKLFARKQVPHRVQDAASGKSERAANDGQSIWEASRQAS
ncbi:MAG TPA: FkbM family methyltransferase [Nitrospiraceae bacterium]|nr:FkbM family methyltransferase [Nitrospiraceae bacterium]